MAHGSPFFRGSLDLHTGRLFGFESLGPESLGPESLTFDRSASEKTLELKAMGLAWLDPQPWEPNNVTEVRQERTGEHLAMI